MLSRPMSWMWCSRRRYLFTMCTCSGVRVVSSKALSLSTAAPAAPSPFPFTTLSDRLRLTPAHCTAEPALDIVSEEEVEERAKEHASRIQSRQSSLQVRSSKPAVSMGTAADSLASARAVNLSTHSSIVCTCFIATFSIFKLSRRSTGTKGTVLPFSVTCKPAKRAVAADQKRTFTCAPCLGVASASADRATISPPTLCTPATLSGPPTCSWCFSESNRLTQYRLRIACWVQVDCRSCTCEGDMVALDTRGK
mmetsp:Transcript_18924/g.32809  ORF Transcript_18924/g.32809 Transcript_18924/m.32809 type:complete len:252 (-) Transcript_18924:586-1341(-)